jgi:hypothetical protein
MQIYRYNKFRRGPVWVGNQWEGRGKGKVDGSVNMMEVGCIHENSITKKIQKQQRRS